MHPLRSVREVRVDLKTVEVADDEQWGILERFAVQKELVVCGLQILPRPLVLPAEVAPSPHVGEAVAAVDLLGAFLEGVALASRVLIRSRSAEHLTEINEVLLRRSALGASAAEPFARELRRSQHHATVRPACRSTISILLKPTDGNRTDPVAEGWSSRRQIAEAIAEYAQG
jgi:hypothetical protein